jgi:lipopolysaccharide transport system ATP-binding protein
LRHLVPRDYFWALRHLSFQLPRGAMLGVVGANGAGKSTLLHLLGRVMQPNEGMVQIGGRMGALFDLSTGFHPELTGRENVMVSGVIAGLTRREVLNRFDEMVQFAELESAIDQPMRTYSTGMQMRLGFAVATFTDPDILLVDEALAVGDLAFRNKCLARITEFRKRGVTIVLVSHDTALVQDFCDEVLWLRGGEQAAYGQAGAVITSYVNAMKSETRERTPRNVAPRQTANGIELRANENRWGSFEMEITSVKLRDDAGDITQVIDSGHSVHVEISFHAPSPVAAPIFGVTIRRKDSGTVVLDTSTEAAGLTLETVHGRGQIDLVIQRLDLEGGSYWVDVGVYRGDWSYAYDYHWNVYEMRVHSAYEGKGVLRPPLCWQLRG